MGVRQAGVTVVSALAAAASILFGINGAISVWQWLCLVVAVAATSTAQALDAFKKGSTLTLECQKKCNNTRVSALMPRWSS
jgi:hypothetical protein